MSIFLWASFNSKNSIFVLAKLKAALSEDSSFKESDIPISGYPIAFIVTLSSLTQPYFDVSFRVSLLTHELSRVSIEKIKM